MNEFLKVKIKSLADEARFIRQGERAALAAGREMSIRAKLLSGGYTEAQIARLVQKAIAPRGTKNQPSDIAFEGRESDRKRIRGFLQRTGLISKLEANLQPLFGSTPEKLDPPQGAWIEAKYKLWEELRDHRRDEVREEARASFIAYGFLRGRRYEQIENYPYAERTPDTLPNWRSVERIVKRFGVDDPKYNSTLMQRFSVWKASATGEAIPPDLSEAVLTAVSSALSQANGVFQTAMTSPAVTKAKRLFKSLLGQ